MHSMASKKVQDLILDNNVQYDFGQMKASMWYIPIQIPLLEKLRICFWNDPLREWSSDIH